MKKIIVLVAMTCPLFANAAPTKCDSAVVSIAQLNLDYAAQSIDWAGEAEAQNPKLVSSSKVEIAKGVEDTELTYHVDGRIHKGTYDIEVKVDSSCFLIGVKLQPKID